MYLNIFDKEMNIEAYYGPNLMKSTRLEEIIAQKCPLVNIYKKVEVIIN